MNKLHLVLIIGTTRVGRMTLHAANLVHKIGLEFEELEIKVVDVKDFFPLPGEGNDPESQNPEWLKINKWSDGYFIVAPEYNHSFPGSLKMLLDNDLKNYNHKSVGIAGVSSGMVGGARMVESLVGTVREMGLFPTSSDIYFPKVQEMFEENGELKIEFESETERIRKSYKELIWLTKTLKYGRENF